LVFVLVLVILVILVHSVLAIDVFAVSCGLLLSLIKRLFLVILISTGPLIPVELVTVIHVILNLVLTVEIVTASILPLFVLIINVSVTVHILFITVEVPGIQTVPFVVQLFIVEEVPVLSITLLVEIEALEDDARSWNPTELEIVPVLSL